MLVLEFKKVHEVYNFGRGGTDFSWERKLAELLVHVIEYVSAKKEMLDLYPWRLCELRSGRLNPAQVWGQSGLDHACTMKLQKATFQGWILNHRACKFSHFQGSRLKSEPTLPLTSLVAI